MLCPDQPASPSPEQLWERADEVRRELCPLLYRTLWLSGMQRHGFKAVLAVFEMALLNEAGHVHTPHGYLWGTLRKPPPACRPDLTLSRLFAARRMPGFLNDRVTYRGPGGKIDEFRC